MRYLIAVALAAALILSPSAALAGSDSPTPYAVTEAGITLPADTTFPDNGHVNYRTTLRTVSHHFEAKCITRTDAECAGKRHDDALLIGTGFLPIDLEPGECLIWVQVSLFDEHFGEGGQEPICPTPDPTDTPTATPEPTEGPEPTEPPVITPPITCTPPYAPGWLDESGQPTGCVWNGPDPTEEPSSPTPTPAPSPSPSLPAEIVPAPAPVGVDPAPVSPAPSPTSSPSPSSTPARTSLAETGAEGAALGLIAVAMICAGIATHMLLRRKP